MKYKNKPGWYDADLNPVPKETHGAKYYDSLLEYQFARMMYVRGIEFERSPNGWPYTQKKSYRPDFRIVVDGKDYFVECKGRFLPGDKTKLRLATAQNPDKELLIYRGGDLVPAVELLGERKCIKF